jgi:YD repeat-containing protein
MATRINVKVVLIVCSVVVLVLGAIGAFFIVDRLARPERDRVAGEEFIAQAQQHLEQGEFEEYHEAMQQGLRHWERSLGRRQDQHNLRIAMIEALGEQQPQHQAEATELTRKALGNAAYLVSQRPGDAQSAQLYYELLVDRARRLSPAFYDNLMQAADEALQRNAADVLARKYRGIGQVHRLTLQSTPGERQQTLDDLNAAAEAMPDDAEVQSALARWYQLEAARQEQQNEQEAADAAREQAFAHSRRSVELAPEDPTRLLQHATTLLSGDEAQQDIARQHVRQAEQQLAADPSDGVALMQTLGLLMVLDREPTPATDDAATATLGLQRAEQLAMASLREDPYDLAMGLRLGQIRADQGRLEEAIAAFEQVEQATVRADAVDFTRYNQAKSQATYQLARLLIEQARRNPSQRDALLTQAREAMDRLATSMGSEDTPEMQELRGRLAVVRSRWAEALQHLTRASEARGHGDASLLALAADAARRSGQTGEAVQLLERLVAARPGLTQQRLQLVELLINTDNLQAANAQLQAMVQDGIEHPAMPVLQAQIAASSGQPEQALAMLDQLPLEQMPAANRLHAELLFRTGQAEQAREQYVTMVQSNPADVNLLARLLAITPDPAERRELLANAREAGLPEAQAQRLAVRLDVAEGSADVAAVVQSELDQIDDPIVRMLAEMRFERQQGNEQRAEELFAEATRQQADHPLVIETGFNQALADENWQRANGYIRQGAYENIDLAGGDFMRGRLALAQGEPAQAVTHLRRALQQRQVFGEGWRLLATAQVAAGDENGALESLRTALRQQPDDRSARRQLVALLDRRGETSEALLMLRAMVRSGQVDAALREQYLRYEQQYGSAARAMQQRRELAEQQPGNRDNIRALALLQAQQGDAAAIQTLDGLVQDEGLTRQNAMVLANAHQALDQGDQAIAVMRQYIDAQDPATLEDRLVWAQFLITAGRDADGLRVLAELREDEDPDRRLATRLMADRLFDLGQHEAAAGLYGELHQQFPEDQPVLIRLIESHLRQDRLEYARRFIDRLAEPAQAAQLRAQIALLENDRETAIEQLNVAVDAGGAGDMPGVLMRRAQVLAQDPAQRDAALGDVQTALQSRPGSPAGQVLRANLLTAAGRLDEAIAALQGAVNLMPEQPSVRRQLGQLLAQRGDIAGALTVVQEGVRRFPNDLNWIAQRAGLREASGDHAGAIADRRTIVEAQPQLQTVGPLVRLLLANGRPAEALDLLGEHPDVLNESAALQAARGQALWQTGDQESAQQVFARVLERIQDPQRLAVVLGPLVQSVGLEQTVAMLEQHASGVAPVQVQLVAARLEGQRGRHDAVVRRLEGLSGQLEQLDPAQQVQAHQLLGVSHQEMRQHQQAREAYERVLAIRDDDVQSLNNLAFLLVSDLDEPQTAVPYARRAVELAPRSAAVLDTLGWALHRSGEHDEARRVLQQALQVQPLAVSQYHLAQVFMAQDEPDRARAALYEAMRLANSQQDEDTRRQAEAMLQQISDS